MERINKLKSIYQTIDKGTAEYKMRKLPRFPKIIELEITNHCNFQCLMCPTGLGLSKRERGYMEAFVFQNVLAEAVKEDCQAIKFVGQGESLLHPEAISFLQRAKENGLVVHLTTNGSLMSSEIMKKLIDMKIDSVKFSFQGVDKEGYFALRQKDCFEEVLHKSAMLYEMRGGTKTEPYITIGTTIIDESSEKIKEFKKLCRNKADNVEVGITNLDDVTAGKIQDIEYRKKIDSLHKKQKYLKRRYVCCPQIFDTLAVRWNGDITACCADINGTMVLGNIKKETILACWLGEKESLYRQILAKGEYERIEQCRVCYDVMGWNSGNN